MTIIFYNRLKIIFLAIMRVISIWFLIIIFIGIISLSVEYYFEITNYSLKILFDKLLFLSCTLIVAFYLIHKDFKFINLLKNYSFKFSDIIRTYLTTLVFLFVLFFISYLVNIYRFQGWGTNLYTLPEILERIFLVWILGHFIASLAEEILFRGILLNYIESKISNIVISIIIISIIFSMGHFHYRSFINFLIAFVAGIVIGYYYLKFKSLNGAIGIHFGYNTFNNLIASDPGRGPDVPYLVKLEFDMISTTTISWVEVSIIASFTCMFLYYYYVANINRVKKLFYIW